MFLSPFIEVLILLFQCLVSCWFWFNCRVKLGCELLIDYAVIFYTGAIILKGIGICDRVFYEMYNFSSAIY